MSYDGRDDASDTRGNGFESCQRPNLNSAIILDAHISDTRIDGGPVMLPSLSRVNYGLAVPLGICN